MGIAVRNLYKSYRNLTLFSDFNIDFPEGKISCILGPSGCGKTTLLNMIGQIIPPDSGSFEGTNGLRYSYIFQDNRLLPWKTVRGNIEFVLDHKLMSHHERKIEAEKFIKMVELDGFSDYYPHRLSGGMRQRVSIARAFASPSDVILMDEPLSGLDINLKKSLIEWFNHIWEIDKRTVIFVTHDVDEALLLGDEIFVLSKTPVKIVYRETISKKSGTRDLEGINFKEMKKSLISKI